MRLLHRRLHGAYGVRDSADSGQRLWDIIAFFAGDEAQTNPKESHSVDAEVLLQLRRSCPRAEASVAGAQLPAKGRAAADADGGGHGGAAGACEEDAPDARVDDPSKLESETSGHKESNVTGWQPRSSGRASCPNNKAVQLARMKQSTTRKSGTCRPWPGLAIDWGTDDAGELEVLRARFRAEPASQTADRDS
jgi:hypothetical protein